MRTAASPANAAPALPTAAVATPDSPAAPTETLHRFYIKALSYSNDPLSTQTQSLKQSFNTPRDGFYLLPAKQPLYFLLPPLLH